MKGKISAGVFKVMAVVSALAIGGGYVAWRHGVAKEAMAEQAEAKEKRQRERALHELDEAWQEELELMPGSKNPVRRPLTREEIDAYLEKGRDFIQPIPGIPEGAEDVSNVIPLLPGSKSIKMEIQLKERESRFVPEEYLLPSSKIGILRLPKKESEPSGEEETDLPE